MPIPTHKPVRIKLDPRARRPIYLQIAQQIRHQASVRRLKPGLQLPTVRELARQLGVNFNTVARAYGLLAQGGLISAQPGRGTFILPASTRRKSGSTVLRELTAGYIADARRLRFTDTQIARTLLRGLGRELTPRQPGDNLE